MLSVHINFKKIIENIHKIKKSLKPKTKFCAVVKANAYGLGDKIVANKIEKFIDCFAVSTVDEGIRLRDAGIKKDILILSVTQNIESALKHNLIITIGSLKEAKNLIESNLKPRIHIAVNTGMNRYGCNSILEFISVLNLLSNYKIEGLYTHLSHEEDNPKKVDSSINKFKKYVLIFKKHFPISTIHAACSGTINCPATHFDMVRIGKAIYGGSNGMDTVLNIESKVIAIKKINKGQSVGYNGEYTAIKKMTIGIVAGGYSNGIQTRFSGSDFVTIDKKECKIIGRICMDCFFIDVSEIHNPLNKIVSIISNSKGQTIMDIYRKTKVIACDILCGFNK